MNSELMGRIKVVIIEDSASIRSRLVGLVEEIGNMQVVGEAMTETTAITLCMAKQPDVIILDMQLETGNGLGVMKAINASASANANTNANAHEAQDGNQTAAAKPIIIVLTNFPSPSVQRAAITLGADYFLDKSLEFHKLPALLRTVAQVVTA
jgi:two-component system, OmpR family, response regulator